MKIALYTISFKKGETAQRFGQFLFCGGVEERVAITPLRSRLTVQILLTLLLRT